jgi:hypothetical protein
MILPAGSDVSRHRTLSTTHLARGKTCTLQRDAITICPRVEPGHFQRSELFCWLEILPNIEQILPMPNIAKSYQQPMPNIAKWQCVKTLYPCSSHQNSWDLWMFIPLKMVFS